MNYLPQTTQDMIEQMLEGYPPYMQDAFAGYNWQEQVVRIAAKHRLGDQQRTRLLVETALLLLGAEDAALFPQELMNHIGISEEKAKAVALDIADRVVQEMQTFITENNRDVIMAMQSEYDELGRQDQLDELRTHGVDITGGENTAGQHDTSAEAGQDLQASMSHDPYHEPLFEGDPHQVDLSRDHEVIPPPPMPPVKS